MQWEYKQGKRKPQIGTMIQPLSWRKSRGDNAFHIARSSLTSVTNPQKAPNWGNKQTPSAVNPANTIPKYLKMEKFQVPQPGLEPVTCWPGGVKALS